MLEPRATIIFNLIFVKNEMKTEDPNAHALIISFYKIVNIYSHAIFFFNIFLLFTMRKRKRDGNKNCRNNNNDESKRKKSDDNKNKRNK